MIPKKTEQIKLMRYPFILLPRGVLESSGERHREVELEAKRWCEKPVIPGMNDKLDQELRIAILQQGINWRVILVGIAGQNLEIVTILQRLRPTTEAIHCTINIMIALRRSM